MSSSGSIVVVGTDGSETAHEALVWAAQEARRRGATLRAVYAQPLPVTAGLAYGYVPEMPPDVGGEDVERIRERVAHALADAGFGDVELDVRVHQGHPAQVILQESHDADLVVVGRRGLGGFAAAVMGSTSRYVSAHADRPVVVVPHSA